MENAALYARNILDVIDGMEQTADPEARPLVDLCEKILGGWPAEDIAEAAQAVLDAGHWITRNPMGLPEGVTNAHPNWTGRIAVSDALALIVQEAQQLTI